MDDYTVMKELLELCSKYSVNIEFCEDHTIRLKTIEYDMFNPPKAYYKRLPFYPEIAAFSLEDLIKDFVN